LNLGIKNFKHGKTESQKSATLVPNANFINYFSAIPYDYFFVVREELDANNLQVQVWASTPHPMC
jgi:hypothetical protein